jgi:hypothetical protein
LNRFGADIETVIPFAYQPEVCMTCGEKGLYLLINVSMSKAGGEWARGRCDDEQVDSKLALQQHRGLAIISKGNDHKSGWQLTHIIMQRWGLHLVFRP